jgi:hypothetical protein
MRRIAASFVLACLPLCAVHAQDNPGAKPRVPIEDTYIIVPKYTSEYTLTRSVNHGDEGQLAGGVALTFSDSVAPSLSTDVMIYPIGGSASVATMEAKFRADVSIAEDKGAYTVTQWRESTDYALRRRDGSSWTGRVMSLRMKTEHGEVDSHTYLFHHGIYAYMVRIDMPAGQAGGDLVTVEDTLLRTLMASIQVVSVGSCGRQMSISMRPPGMPVPAGYTDGISPDGFSISVGQEDVEANGREVVADLQSGRGMFGRMRLAAARQIANGCTSTPYAPPAASDELAVLRLHFPADYWQLTPVPH